jgi:hypothetical protein
MTGADTTAIFAKWIADRLTCALEHHEQRGERPVAGKRERRHRKQIQRVSDEGDCPVAAGLVADVA